MATARYWRLVGLSTYAGGDLELGGLHWHNAGGRIDASATLTCSHAPVEGVLANLQDADPATAARFAAADVRAAGYYLAWDFGVAVTDPWPRMAATVRERFLNGATLQFSADARLWTTDLMFSRVIYPGAGSYTPLDPAFRPDLSQWDPDSKGSSASISGRAATVWSNLTGFVRTTAPRRTGRRVFGLRLLVNNSQQRFFGGLSALSGWGSYNTGRHWLLFGFDGFFYYYPTGTRVALSPEPGAPTAVGDIAYFDVDLDAGSCAVKKNSGGWSAHVALPNFVVNADYVVDLQASSTSPTTVTAELLSTSEELAGHIPAGAAPWDDESGAIFLEPEPVSTGGLEVLTAGSAGVPEFAVCRYYAGVARDVEFGGAGRIWGTTTTKATPSNMPTKARVVLLHQRSKQLVRETWSDPATGAFAFEGIDTRQEFLTLAEDAAGAYRPVAANRLVPEVSA